MLSPTSKRNRRIGLRDIATAAGVCSMTVSLSLRGSPRISPATRQRIQELARRLGYQPDPEIARLMKHLRVARTVCGSMGLAAVDLASALPGAGTSTNHRILEGINSRAAAIGANITHFRLAEYENNLPRLMDIIRHRGLEGAIFLPGEAAICLDGQTMWRDVSILSISHAIVTPRFHSVLPQKVDEVARLLGATEPQGGVKIGVLLDQRFQDGLSGMFPALSRCDHGFQVLVLPPTLSMEERSERIAHWVSQWKPDLVLVHAQAHRPDAADGLRSRPTIKAVDSGALAAAPLAFPWPDDNGLDLLGHRAVDLLIEMIYRHETGIPQHPQTTIIDCSDPLRRRACADVLRTPAA